MFSCSSNINDVLEAADFGMRFSCKAKLTDSQLCKDSSLCHLGRGSKDGLYGHKKIRNVDHAPGKWKFLLFQVVLSELQAVIHVVCTTHPFWHCIATGIVILTVHCQTELSIQMVAERNLFFFLIFQLEFQQFNLGFVCFIYNIVPRVSQIQRVPAVPECEKPITSCTLEKISPAECDICWMRHFEKIPYAVSKMEEPCLDAESNLYYKKSQISFTSNAENHAVNFIAEITHCNSQEKKDIPTHVKR
ncbi:hypothetical protein JRQ81_000364 [Phrynocephalus forsythii]|uniref:Uncharacterized protein n=1 Tax=Phrynocephalus forsythii TaxID=171643 RepID=A0A9Q1B7Z5_9SAUR|nr:hypothetical protein JRQ81_000364 [Phrynocephalus forsythii]